MQKIVKKINFTRSYFLKFPVKLEEIFLQYFGLRLANK